MNETEKVLPKPSAKRDCTIIQVSLPLQAAGCPACLTNLFAWTGQSNGQLSTSSDFSGLC